MHAFERRTGQEARMAIGAKPSRPIVSVRGLRPGHDAPAEPPRVESAARPTPVKVEIRNLHFFYKDFEALKGIALPLYDKCVTAFIGPSGCGKSTLLRVLNRIYELYPNQRAEGQVLLDGEDILSARLDTNLLRSRVGMVFQKPTPFPMTIYDNIAFGIKLYER